MSNFLYGKLIAELSKDKQLFGQQDSTPENIWDDVWMINETTSEQNLSREQNS